MGSSEVLGWLPIGAVDFDNPNGDFVGEASFQARDGAAATLKTAQAMDKQAKDEAKAVSFLLSRNRFQNS